MIFFLTRISLYETGNAIQKIPIILFITIAEFPEIHFFKETRSTLG